MTHETQMTNSESQTQYNSISNNNNINNKYTNNLSVALKSFTSILNTKSLFDLLSKKAETITTEAATKTTTNKIATAGKLTTTAATTRTLLKSSSSLSSSSPATSSPASSALTTTTTMTTKPTTTKVTNLAAATATTTATSASYLMQEQQSNHNDCRRAATATYAPADTLSSSSSSSLNSLTSHSHSSSSSSLFLCTSSASSSFSSFNAAASSCYAATLTAASADLWRCNMAKIASEFLTAIVSSSNNNNYNKAHQQPQEQQKQQQQQKLPQFISFNSRKPKRKVCNVQQQQHESEQHQQLHPPHPHRRRHRHHQQHRRCSSLDCFLAAAVFSLVFLMAERLQIVRATSGLLSKNEPMFISRSETFKFVSGDTIVLPCEVANTEPYIVAWKRGIAILFAGSVKVSPDPRLRLMNGFNLQIRDAVPQDAGDYICQIATMEPREITHTVEILVPPRIHHISTGGHLQVKKGSSVRIECSASGNPTPNVTWSRKNNILPNGEEKLHSHILSIENVDRHKGGVYICSANNGVGQPASSQVVLHVLYPPEISVERPVVFSGEGHEAMLVCIVHGETQPEVIWFKDTMQLDTTERHIMETRGSRHTLIIRKVHPQDFGNYSCVAENQLGKSRKTLQLSGKPNLAVFSSPPISQYKDRYNISWTVDSHTPIEEYKLSFRRMPQGHEVDNSIDHSVSSSSSANLLQIYGGNNHNHRINVGGSGVVDLHGGGYGGGNLLHWGRNDWRDVVLPAMPLSHHYTQGMSYMIRGLDPDQHYEATVQARNRYGWSDLTHSFVFSTSSNDGLIDLTTFLNHGLSDNEMRDLSVTYYGSASDTLYMSTAMLLGITFILVTSSNFFY